MCHTNYVFVFLRLGLKRSHTPYLRCLSPQASHKEAGEFEKSVISSYHKSALNWLKLWPLNLFNEFFLDRFLLNCHQVIKFHWKHLPEYYTAHFPSNENLQSSLHAIFTSNWQRHDSDILDDDGSHLIQSKTIISKSCRPLIIGRQTRISKTRLSPLCSSK